MAEIQVEKPQPVIEFETRKKFAKEGSLCDFEHDGKFFVKIDDNGVICDSLCSYCFNPTGSSPYKNCKEGVHVSPVCVSCLRDYLYIHDYLKSNGKCKDVSKRRMRRDNMVSEIDWKKLDDQIDNGKAKLTVIARQLRIDTSDLRQAIVKKYGDKIQFKKGRNGGIIRANDPKMQGSNQQSSNRKDPMNSQDDTKKVVDFAYVDREIDSGNAKLSQLSKHFGIYPNEMRATLIAHYGNKIEFRRGRNGGIKKVSKSTTNSSN